MILVDGFDYVCHLEPLAQLQSQSLSRRFHVSLTTRTIEFPYVDTSERSINRDVDVVG